MAKKKALQHSRFTPRGGGVGFVEASSSSKKLPILVAILPEFTLF